MEDLSKIIDQGVITAKANDILTPELAAKIGAVHGTYLGSNGILVAARDYSNNSRMLKRAYIAGTLSTGVDILNLHSSPLPLVQFCIRRFGATGGVYISSSHTYGGESAIRFFDSSGIEFSERNMESIVNFFLNEKISRAGPLNIGTLSDLQQTFEVYKKAVPQFVSRKIISEADLKVVIDCSHGPTGELAPEILNSINTGVVALNTYFRPVTRKYSNLNAVRDCSSIIRASNADLGAVFDTDGTRLLVLDETGHLVEFEDLFILIISNEEAILNNIANPIITTTNCSKILDEFAENMKFKLEKVQYMPGAISRKIRENRGAFGAADSFKFYFPQYGPFSDGIITLLKLLEIIANKNEPLSSLIRKFPKSIKTHKTINVDETILDNYDKIIKSKLKNEGLIFVDTILGVKILFGDEAWVKIIPNLYRNTLEFTSEAPERKYSEKLIKQIEDTLNK
ncbi:MAG: hypothetical protein ACTSWY_13740 [Promethearchaeota archaeon]